MDVIRYRARDLRNNATDAERAPWRALRGRQIDGYRFRRQVPIAGYIADFACPQLKLIVELDGASMRARESTMRRAPFAWKRRAIVCCGTGMTMCCCVWSWWWTIFTVI